MGASTYSIYVHTQKAQKTAAEAPHQKRVSPVMDIKSQSQSGGAGIWGGGV